MVCNAMFEVVDTHFPGTTSCWYLKATTPRTTDDSLYKLASVGSAFLVEATFDVVSDNRQSKNFVH
jgi:hypothetical protein